MSPPATILNPVPLILVIVAASNLILSTVSSLNVPTRVKPSAEVTVDPSAVLLRILVPSTLSCGTGLSGPDIMLIS
jgi:hypothetical protein